MVVCYLQAVNFTKLPSANQNGLSALTASCLSGSQALSHHLPLEKLSLQTDRSRAKL